MRTIETVEYRGQVLTHDEWTTWNGKPADGWGWKTTAEQRKKMPWLPMSTGFKTLEQMKAKIDHYFDKVTMEREEMLYLSNQAAAAAWVEAYGDDS